MKYLPVALLACAIIVGLASARNVGKLDVEEILALKCQNCKAHCLNLSDGTPDAITVCTALACIDYC